jgi:hypothetical protein
VFSLKKDSPSSYIAFHKDLFEEMQIRTAAAAETPLKRVFFYGSKIFFTMGAWGSLTQTI